MPRAKGGFKTRHRRKKILKMASGFRGAKSRLIRVATESVRHALQYATRDRKVRKRDFRKLWITRIGSAARLQGVSYSQLISRLTKSGIQINRKMLAEMAVRNPSAFAAVVESVRQAP